MSHTHLISSGTTRPGHRFHVYLRALPVEINILALVLLSDDGRYCDRSARNLATSTHRPPPPPLLYQADGERNGLKQQQQQQQHQRKKEEEAQQEACPVKAIKRILRPANTEELQQLREKVG